MINRPGNSDPWWIVIVVGKTNLVFGRALVVQAPGGMGAREKALKGYEQGLITYGCFGPFDEQPEENFDS